VFKKIITGFVFAVGLLAAAVTWAAASPTVDEVLQAYRAGDYARAEGMMDQVLLEHANNAYAHFLQAQVLAKQGKLAAARSQLESAQKLNPTLSFAKPAALQELKSELAGQSSQSQARQAATDTAGGSSSKSGGFSLSRVIIVVLAVLALWAFLRSRRQRALGSMTGLGAGGPGPMAYPNGGSAAPMQPQAGGGMGSGIMGGLASGAALGAGMIAGESLMHKVLGDGGQRAVPASDDVTSSLADTRNTGDADFSPANSQAGWDADFSPNDEQASWDNDNSGSDDNGGGNSDDWS